MYFVRVEILYAHTHLQEKTQRSLTIMAASAAFILSKLDESFDAKCKQQDASLDLSIDTRNSLLDTSTDTSLNDSFYTNTTEETDHTLKVTNVSKKCKQKHTNNMLRILEDPIEAFASKVRYRIKHEKKIMKMKAMRNHRKYQGFSEVLRNSFHCGCTSTVDDDDDEDDSYDS